MELHTCLWSDIVAFDFNADDLAPLLHAFPGLDLVMHRSAGDFLAAAERATWLLTWDFEAAWYELCPSLEAIFTPAAGNDWVAADPAGRVRLVHGTFHGQLLSESLLGALLYMNHRMPAMSRNFQHRAWDRNLQAGCRLLRNQTVLIIGLGHIGSACAQTIRAFGASVIGIKRDPTRRYRPLPGVDVRGLDRLHETLPLADHVVLLLPGSPDTDGILSRELLQQCKPGAYVYNFGRGNALRSDDLLASLGHLGGAFLDVVDEEPLVKSSPLWRHPDIMITPHSSCVYREYKSAFIAEVIARGRREFA